MTSASTFADFHRKTASARYAHGVRAGVVAELFGLGPRGIRWRQAAVVVIGAWLSGNAFDLVRGDVSFDVPPAALVSILAWPIIFTFAAITAIRSFQSPLVIAGATGALHTLLFTGLRIALSDQNLEAYAVEFPVWQRAAISFSWTFLDMLAIQIAVSAGLRWIGLVVALSLSSVAQGIAIRFMQGGEFDLQTYIGGLGGEWARILVNAGAWASALWINWRWWKTAAAAQSSIVAEMPVAVESTDSADVEAAPSLVSAGLLFLPLVAFGAVLVVLFVFVESFQSFSESWSSGSTLVQATGFWAPAFAALTALAGRKWRYRTLALALVSLSAPYLGILDVETGIAITGSGGLGAVAMGLSEVLVSVPFGMVAILAVAVAFQPERSTAAFPRSIQIALLFGAAVTYLDVLTIQGFQQMAATGGPASNDLSGALAQWVIDLLTR